MRKLFVSLVVLFFIALGFVHYILPGQFEKTLNKVVPHDPYVVSDEARALHETLIVADLHEDSLLWKRDLSKRADRGHVDFPRLQEGNVTLQVFTAVTKVPEGQNYEKNNMDGGDKIDLAARMQLWPLRTWNSIYERAVYQAEKLEGYAERNPDQVAFVKSKADLSDVLARRDAGENVVAAIYGVEGAQPFEGDIAKLDSLYDMGLRVIGLTHFFDNELGGSLHGESGEGLTEFGRQVIMRANEKDMIIDVAHASPQMVRDVLELSTRPVILSHGGMKGTCDTARNLDDELMVEFAAKGGIIGIGYWDGAVCDFTPAGVVKSIRYAVDLMGVDHVALGSDYDGATTVMFDTSELVVLTDEMLKAGFSEDEIRKIMGENVLAFFEEQLPAE